MRRGAAAFAGGGAAYAGFRPSYPPELARWLASLPARRLLAWDSACGSGQMTVPLADHFSRVIGTDASDDQLRHAIPHPRVRYARGDERGSGCADHSVDLVTVAQAAHWLELPALYDEARRVGAPGSVIALVSYGRTRISPAVDDVVEQFYHDVIGPWWAPERRHVDTGYAELPFPFAPIGAPAMSLTRDWPLDHFMGYVGSWSATRAHVAERGAGEVDALRARLAPLWRDTLGVEWPLAIRAGQLSVGASGAS
jgi:SAM-dependent methyltransferase